MAPVGTTTHTVLTSDGTSNDTLVVEYLDAQHADWINGSLGVNGRVINISMKSGVNDPTAPRGGMLYNLERRR